MYYLENNNSAGEPRRIDDPANMAFISAISRGQCPPELIPEDPSIHVNINLVRRAEDYTPPAQPKFKAFAGSGRKMTSSDAGPSAPSSSAAPATGSKVAWEGPDESKPTTSIQLRLADGSRVVATFNLTQTVGDIRRFIKACRLDMNSNYTLSTAFPTKQLTEDGVSIEEAGLKNSVVIQKMSS